MFWALLLRHLVALGTPVVLRDVGGGRRERHGVDWGLITVDFNRFSYPQQRVFPRPQQGRE